MSRASDLFLTFARIGLFTFGGGYAMIPLIEEACVRKKQWITHDEMMTITVISESTPGPVAINCATYVGYKQRGWAGAAAATAGMTLPSFCIIFLISLFLDRFLAIGWIAGAFRGIKLAVCLLIADAGFRMLRKMPKKPWPRAITVGGFLAMMAVNLFSLPVSSVVLLLAAALLGLAVFSHHPERGDGNA